MASKIVELLPQHKVYVEPFAGGLAVLFAKGLSRVTNQQDYGEVINDNSKDLINLYRVMQDSVKSEQLITKLGWTLYSRDEYRLSRDILRDDTSDDVTRAWAYYVNINQSFANKLNGGWGVCVQTASKASGFNLKTNRLPQIKERLSKVYIECRDALEVIKQWDSEHTCFYCDPPYPDTHQGHYGGYSIDDFLRLCEALNNIQGSFVLSNYHQEMPDYGWDRFEFQASMSAARDKTLNRERTEVVWRKVSEWAMAQEQDYLPLFNYAIA